jgi:hypothetical protein
MLTLWSQALNHLRNEELFISKLSCAKTLLLLTNNEAFVLMDITLWSETTVEALATQLCVSTALNKSKATISNMIVVVIFPFINSPPSKITKNGNCLLVIYLQLPLFMLF